jgi:hypothetical protein
MYLKPQKSIAKSCKDHSLKISAQSDENNQS